MRLPSMAFALGAAGALVAGCSGSPSTTAEPSGDLSEAIWVLDIEDCANRPGRRATGFVVQTDDGPVLVSVAHAVDDARSISAVDADGTAIPLTVHHLDTELDIGVYSAPSNSVALTLDPDARPDAAEVWIRRDAEAVASPVAVDVLRWVDVELDGAGKRLGLELGRPAGAVGDAADDGDLIRSGDSGAPVVDPDTNHVVGMVFAAARTGDRGWATAATMIDAVLGAASRDAAVELTCEP